VLATDDYAEARALSRAATDPPRAPSAQSFQLVKAIRALDDALGDPPADHVVEVHPELAFRALDPDLRDAKVTARGMARRLAALRTVMDVDAALLAAPPRVPAVDALDACAAAWSARRIADGTAECVGDGATDARGRPMRISW
jgi:predicted RNase H-like nuclease